VPFCEVVQAIQRPERVESLESWEDEYTELGGTIWGEFNRNYGDYNL
jgi:hypothetical protein